jgi:deoxyribonuclease V
VGFDELKTIQQSIAERVSVKDDFEKINKVAGCDQAFFDDSAVSAVVVCRFGSLEAIEKKYVIEKPAMPYVPGYLSFREGPPIMKAFKKLKHRPDMLLVDGNGVLHPRLAGLASHVGVELDVPAIGVAKSLLLGDMKRGSIYVNGELRGRAFRTRKGCRPIYISPGHRVSLESSVRIVRSLLRGYKLPEPLRLAHNYANQIKREVMRYGNRPAGFPA